MAAQQRPPGQTEHQSLHPQRGMPLRPDTQTLQKNLKVALSPVKSGIICQMHGHPHPGTQIFFQQQTRATHEPEYHPPEYRQEQEQHQH
ncbi:hypothetical protein ACJU26_15025 [Acidithiobacillus sp. M4-SHS-6]|uniref:hypothetical protein n=1 Tax=Acidithiobacillus sp. M4-SHS-6 TaxID=3383024 RepID=UPI0039BEAA7B